MLFDWMMKLQQKGKRNRLTSLEHYCRNSCMSYEIVQHNINTFRAGIANFDSPSGTSQKARLLWYTPAWLILKTPITFLYFLPVSTLSKVWARFILSAWVSLLLDSAITYWHISASGSGIFLSAGIVELAFQSSVDCQLACSQQPHHWRWLEEQ